MARSCGTCRDRRIACDKAVPACSQCRQSSRSCKGYGIRLSWPRANDPKRAVVCRAPVRFPRPDLVKAFRFQVNASSWDVEMHHSLLGSLSTNPAKPGIQIPMPFDFCQYNDAEGQLFDYFQHTASQSLAILGHDTQDLGRLLLRMAFGSSCPITKAVQTAILAFASLHHHGVQGQAFDFKVAALSALGKASKTCIKDAEALHVAAGMLLCTFDIHKAACTSGQWRFYVTGVKSVIANSYLLQYRYGKSRDIDADLSMLLDWVHYHDALARFSSLHWNREPHNVCFPAQICLELHQKNKGLTSDALVAQWSHPALAIRMMQVLEYGCEALSGRLRAAGAKVDYSIHNLARLLEPVPFSPTTDQTLELFYHAILVYLNRASNHALEPSTTTQKRKQRAFDLFPTLSVLSRQFPLFILGSEARTDEERCIILDLLDRTEADPSSRSFFLVREFINMVWVQRDLALFEGREDSEKGLGYGEVFSAVLGVTLILPPFV
ncbi:hypothetical protein BDV06DRAFT_218440 [Aspergillus oleicola]